MMTVVSTRAVPSDDSDLAVLHRQHYRSLVRLASVLVEDLGTCEELVQDAFVAALGRGWVLRDATKAPAYLRSAVLNGARSHLRRRQVRERPRALQVVRTERAAEAGALAALHRALEDRE